MCNEQRICWATCIEEKDIQTMADCTHALLFPHSMEDPENKDHIQGNVYFQVVWKFPFTMDLLKTTFYRRTGNKNYGTQDWDFSLTEFKQRRRKGSARIGRGLTGGDGGTVTAVYETVKKVTIKL